MDDFEKILELESESKRQIDKMNINYLTNVDYLICDYVLDQLVNIDVSKINYGRRISLNELIEKSLFEMKVFGSSVENKIIELLSRTSIESTSCVDQFGTEISYSFDNNECIIFNSGIVNKYIISSELYELSTYYFTHEHIHAIKDTNYNEYKNCITLGETIPLFYELMVYNPDEVIKRELLKFRMFWMISNANDYFLLNYLYLDEWINEWGCDTGNDTKFDIYSFMISKVGCYLNSFYYAVILYNMYKENPEKILYLVSRVLKHEITTQQMLDTLGIYGDIRGGVFEKEFCKIRKLIK